MILGTGSTMCISLYIWLKFLFQNNGTPAQRTRWRSQQPKVWRHGGQNELFVLLDNFVKTQLCIFFNQTTQSATAWCSVGPFVHSTTLVIITLIKSMANTIYILAWSLNCKIWPPCYFQPIANSSGARNASVAKGEVMTQRWTSWLCQNPEFYKIV